MNQKFGFNWQKSVILSTNTGCRPALKPPRGTTTYAFQIVEVRVTLHFAFSHFAQNHTILIQSIKLRSMVVVHVHGEVTVFLATNGARSLAPRDGAEVPKCSMFGYATLW